MKTLDDLLALLAEVGVPEDVLQEADGSWQLRQDLALSSAETVALQALLKARCVNAPSLWGGRDYSLEQLISEMS
ncbi:hypothetical protein SMQE32_17930 [Serratia marcescens]|jgi:hypothetical protein|uniref:Uncharacterized protein n=2 Tax=Serratia TaxID=613 RepID=A0A9X9C477_9GAMM|nr:MULTISPECIES: hypothetical protein [Serratia]KAB5496670.1 hypothetical protein F8564_12330 [Enterobacter sp. RJAL6]KLE37251.1 hypothetical protein ABA78_15850 [Serratia sp. TEL]ALD46867.1 hypothetical protein AN479_21630 [Serratia marcescens]ASL92827.1 hypothetical protein BVG94_09340 [Serratia marcescens]ASM02357.1 hypothetical protein BVG88_09430 [Serratia marcescens]